MTDPKDLKRMLDQAAAGPTTATFDQVIDRAQRSRQTRWLVATSAVMVLVATAIVLPITLTGSSSHDNPIVGPEVHNTNGSSDNANPGDVFKLVNRWIVDAPGAHGDQLVIGDSVDGGLVLFEPCGELQGSWSADPTGDFVADLDGGAENCFSEARSAGTNPIDLPWLDQATSFTITADGAELNGAGGTVLARLTPSTTLPPHSVHDSDDYRIPKLTSQLRKRLAPPAPLPRQLTPATATSILGWWKPTDTTNSAAFLSFRSDGTADGSDGCNGAGGRYVIGPGGQLLSVAEPNGLVGCNSSRVVGEFGSPGRVGIDSAGRLVLTDARGSIVGRLVSVPLGHVVGTFVSEGGPAGAKPDPDSGTIRFTQTGGPGGISTYASATDGKFAIDLPAGSYTLVGNTPSFIIDGQQGGCRGEGIVTVAVGATVNAGVGCERK